MNRVVENCFSTRKISFELHKNIQDLRKSFYAFNVSETLKIHILINHVEKCLEYIDNVGLGVWAEQAGESIYTPRIP